MNNSCQTSHTLHLAGCDVKPFNGFFSDFSSVDVPSDRRESSLSLGSNFAFDSSLGTICENTSLDQSLIAKSWSYSVGDSLDFRFGQQKINRKLKFTLQSVARDLLCKDNEFKALNTCCRVSVAKDGFVSIGCSPQHNLSFFGGLATCGSVWLCPVCSSKIAAVRVSELEFCIREHLFQDASNNAVYMLVLTASHSIGDSLSYLEKKLSEARQIFWRTGYVRKLLGDLNMIGRVTSHEVTFSVRNGFHPHDHVLIFSDCISYENMKVYEEKLRNAWISALNRVGLAGNEHSFRFSGGNLTSEYVNKLGLECTLGHIKRGKIVGDTEHFSPFQMLNYISEHGESDSLSLVLMSAFKEYAYSIKGKQQLKYSRGLKDYFGLSDISDSDCLSCEPSDSFTVLYFDSSDYKKLLVSDLRCSVLNFFDSADYSSGIKLLLDIGVSIRFIHDSVLDILKKEGIFIKLE